MNGFGKKIAEYQDELIDQRDKDKNDIAAVRQRLFGEDAMVARRVARRSIRVPVVGWGLAAAACAVVAVLVVFWPADHSDSSLLEAPSLKGEWLFARDGAREVAFQDQSRIVLDQGASARILGEEKHAVHFLLEQGRARVNVIHHSDTNWTLDVGPYKVNVVGTRFTIAWEPDTQVFTLNLQEGAVEVFGPMVEDGRRISRREQFIASVAKGTIQIQSEEPVKTALDSASDEESNNTANGPVADKASDCASSVCAPLANGVVSKGSGKYRDKNARSGSKSVYRNDATAAQLENRVTWQELNHEGKFAEVVKDAQSIGIAAALGQKPVAELMALGDAARFQRDWQLAGDAYQTLRKRAPGSGSASIAAFSMGRIDFDVRKDYNAAAKWLEIYLKEAPSGRFAKEALGRLMEARQNIGNSAGARSAAAEYLKKYPSGPHSELANSILIK